MTKQTNYGIEYMKHNLIPSTRLTKIIENRLSCCMQAKTRGAMSVQLFNDEYL